MTKWASLDLPHVPDTFNLRPPQRIPHGAFTACFMLLCLVTNAGCSYYSLNIDANDCELPAPFSHLN
jgi:hypothetical protein